MKTIDSKTQDLKTMNRDAFWEVMAEAQNRKNTYDNNGLDEALMEVLDEKFTNQALVQYHLLIEELRNELPPATHSIAREILGYDDIQGAPYHRFKNWVISLGKEHYQRAVLEPDYLLTIKDPNHFVAGHALFEDLDHIATAVYYDREEKDPSLMDWGERLNKEIHTRSQGWLEGLRDQDEDRGMER